MPISRSLPLPPVAVVGREVDAHAGDGVPKAGRIVAVATVEGVVAEAAVELIGAVATAQRVVAGAAARPLVALLQADEVVVVGAADDLDADQAIRAARPSSSAPP